MSRAGEEYSWSDLARGLKTEETALKDLRGQVRAYLPCRVTVLACILGPSVTTGQPAAPSRLGINVMITAPT